MVRLATVAYFRCCLDVFEGMVWGWAHGHTEKRGGYIPRPPRSEL